MTRLESRQGRSLRRVTRNAQPSIIAALLENAAQAYARGEYSIAYKNWTQSIDLGKCRRCSRRAAQ
jgi:hypothetical protein